jgi:hypothetical protein
VANPPRPKHGLSIIDRTRVHRRWFNRWVAVATFGTLGCTMLFLSLMARPRPADTEPIATTGMPVATALPVAVSPAVIVVTDDRITVDGVEVARTADVAAAQRLVRVDGLFDALKARRMTAREPEHSAVLQASPDVPALVVKCVFQTAAFAGYDDVRFGVVREGG